MDIHRPITYILVVPAAAVVCAHRPTFRVPEQVVTYEAFAVDTHTVNEASNRLRWIAKHMENQVRPEGAPKPCWLWQVADGHNIDVDAAVKAMRGKVHPAL